MFSDALEHPGDAQLCVWASLPEGTLQNPHPPNPPCMPGNHFTPSTLQTLLLERFLPPPGSEQSLVTHFPPGCRFVRRFLYRREYSKGHLSVCCRPLAPVITAEGREARALIFACFIVPSPFAWEAAFRPGLPSCSSELMRFCCT